MGGGWGCLWASSVWVWGGDFIFYNISAINICTKHLLKVKKSIILIVTKNWEICIAPRTNKFRYLRFQPFLSCEANRTFDGLALCLLLQRQYFLWVVYFNEKITCARPRNWNCQFLELAFWCWGLCFYSKAFTGFIFR